MGQKKSRKIPGKFPAEIPSPKNFKITDKLLQECRENKGGFVKKGGFDECALVPVSCTGVPLKKFFCYTLVPVLGSRSTGFCTLIPVLYKLFAPHPKHPILGPRKKLCASFPGKDRKKGTHINFFGGSRITLGKPEFHV